jgi:hypothetical protein
VADVNPLLGLDFVMFWHKVAGAGIRAYRAGEEIVPEPDDMDYVLPPDTDLFAPIFRDVKDGSSWSLNDIWLKVQETLNPYAEIEKAAPASGGANRTHPLPWNSYCRDFGRTPAAGTRLPRRSDVDRTGDCLDRGGAQG